MEKQHQGVDHIYMIMIYDKRVIYDHNLQFSHHTGTMSDSTFEINNIFTWHMEFFSSSCCGIHDRNINGKGDSFFFSSVQLDLENMKDVGNCGPPGQFQLVALRSSV